MAHSALMGSRASTSRRAPRVATHVQALVGGREAKIGRRLASRLPNLLPGRHRIQDHRMHQTIIIIAALLRGACKRPFLSAACKRRSVIRICYKDSEPQAQKSYESVGILSPRCRIPTNKPPNYCYYCYDCIIVVIAIIVMIAMIVIRGACKRP